MTLCVDNIDEDEICRGYDMIYRYQITTVSNILLALLIKPLKSTVQESTRSTPEREGMSSLRNASYTFKRAALIIIAKLTN